MHLVKVLHIRPSCTCTYMYVYLPVGLVAHLSTSCLLSLASVSPAKKGGGACSHVTRSCDPTTSPSGGQTSLIDEVMPEPRGKDTLLCVGVVGEVWRRGLKVGEGREGSLEV